MPSKTSKHRNNSRQAPPSFLLWKAESACAEPRVLALARELAPALRPGDRVLLEGPMGVGKTTFARHLLQGLGVEQPPEGSPSFAIAHEYRAPRAEVVHVDFYRIRHEQEIEEAGIEAYFWERDALVIAEWTSLWPEFEGAVLKTGRGRLWRIQLSFSPGSAELRDVSIRKG